MFISPSISLLRIYLRKIKSYVHPKICMYKFLEAVFAIAQNWKPVNVYQQARRSVEYPHNEILLRSKNGVTSDTYTNMHVSQKLYTKWKGHMLKNYVLYEFIYMKFQKR